MEQEAEVHLTQRPKLVQVGVFEAVDQTVAFCLGQPHTRHAGGRGHGRKGTVYRNTLPV